MRYEIDFMKEKQGESKFRDREKSTMDKPQEEFISPEPNTAQGVPPPPAKTVPPYRPKK